MLSRAPVNPSSALASNFSSNRSKSLHPLVIIVLQNTSCLQGSHSPRPPCTNGSATRVPVWDWYSVTQQPCVDTRSIATPTAATSAATTKLILLMCPCRFTAIIRACGKNSEVRPYELQVLKVDTEASSPCPVMYVVRAGDHVVCTIMHGLYHNAQEEWPYTASLPIQDGRLRDGTN